MREVKESKKREKKRRGERKEGKEVALVRKMRTAHFRGDAWQKCDFAALYYSFWVQRHAARNVCEAPLCGCMSKHFTFIRKICSLIHLQYLCEESCFAVAFCEYGAYRGAASRCRISRFCQRKNISLFGVIIVRHVVEKLHIA